MKKMLDLDFIRKWVKISEEELMLRLVIDAIALQEEAEANKAAFDKAERLANPEYARIVMKFWKQVPYLEKYFSQKEIVNAAASYLSINDIIDFYYVRGFNDKLNFGEFVEYENSHKFVETKGDWSREIYDKCSVYRVSSNYQLHGCDAVKELLELKCPYLKEYNVSVYDVSDRNDWIYIHINNNSLYCPVSALMEKDAAKIIKTHLNYWHDYAKGEKDVEEKNFIASEEVQQFLELVAQ